MTRTRGVGILHLAGLLVIVPLACAQEATSRAEQMEQIRTDKQARLWPEHTPGVVKMLNNYAERGLLEGARSGKGVNGLQIVLGGMRSGNGTTISTRRWSISASRNSATRWPAGSPAS